jgi:hypothetical protein
MNNKELQQQGMVKEALNKPFDQLRINVKQLILLTVKQGFPEQSRSQPFREIRLFLLTGQNIAFYSCI